MSPKKRKLVRRERITQKLSRFPTKQMLKQLYRPRIRLRLLLKREMSSLGK
jgi:hypothetical protein